MVSCTDLCSKLLEAVKKRVLRGPSERIAELFSITYQDCVKRCEENA